jgi:hypothetical protein
VYTLYGDRDLAVPHDPHRYPRVNVQRRQQARTGVPCVMNPNQLHVRTDVEQSGTHEHILPQLAKAELPSGPGASRSAITDACVASAKHDRIRLEHVSGT